MHTLYYPLPYRYTGTVRVNWKKWIHTIQAVSVCERCKDEGEFMKEVKYYHGSSTAGSTPVVNSSYITGGQQQAVIGTAEHRARMLRPRWWSYKTPKHEHYIVVPLHFFLCSRTLFVLGTNWLTASSIRRGLKGLTFGLTFQAWQWPSTLSR